MSSLLQKLFISILLYSSLSFFTKETIAKNICNKQKVCLFIKNQSSKYQIYAVNTLKTEVSIYVDLELNNVKINRSLPFTTILKPKQKKHIISAKIDNIHKKSNIRASYRWLHGKLDSNHNYTHYKLPYKYRTVKIVGQSFDTDQTHQGITKYAIDWNMPIGTHIHAARDGIVIATENKFERAGNSAAFGDKSNYIKIQHSDGTISIYGHLQKNGVKVKVGDYVRTRQFIGLSGNTGYSTGPHLHFHVAKPVLYQGKLIEKTIPFKFINCTSPDPFIPQTGKKYKSC